MCGDFNARTGDVNDFVENDELDEYLPVNVNYIPDNHLVRRINKDSSTLNANGSALIEFCKSSGYRILNGRLNKNITSNFTCFNARVNSCVDYLLLREEHFLKVDQIN